MGQVGSLSHFLLKRRKINMWYKFWVFGSSPFDAVYGQVDSELTDKVETIKVRYAFSIQPSEGGMSIVPLTKNKQGEGVPFTTANEYLYLTPAMWAPVDENDEHFRNVSSKLSSSIEIASKIRSSKIFTGE
jgi:hypothetical protein